jgi:hypothetical protein
MCPQDELFTCPRHAGGLRLMPKSCGAMWLRAAKHCADRSDPLHPCVGCAIGANHAGQPPERSQSSCDVVCPRCMRSATKIVKGVCVSCYNREREVRIGRDRRGHVPISARLPVPMTIMLVTASGFVSFERHAVSLLEVMVFAAQRHRDPVAFYPPLPATRSLAIS